MLNLVKIKEYILRFIPLIICFLLMWFVFLLSLFGFNANSLGIVPRQTGSLINILTSPFAHANFQHIISNSLPFLILGVIVSLNGAKHFIFSFLSILLFSGIYVWLFGSVSNHLGMSSVVFGLFALLIFRSIFIFNIFWLIFSVIICYFYYQMIFLGLIPQEHISFAGHFGGFLSGILTAFLLKFNNIK